MTMYCYVVMGVSGAGKSVIGAAFANRINAHFLDADHFHSDHNRARMASGVPLTDTDRQEWLQLLAAQLAQHREQNRVVVLACSALKRSYRDLLRTGAPALTLIYLHGDRATIATRLAGRVEHFMPVALLDSQFSTLEEPSSDEGAWVCDIGESADDIVAALASRVHTAYTAT